TCTGGRAIEMLLSTFIPTPFACLLGEAYLGTRMAPTRTLQTTRSLEADVARENEDSGTWDQVRWNHEAHHDGGDGGPSPNDTSHQQHDGEQDHRRDCGPFAELSERMPRGETRAGGSKDVRLCISPSITGDGVDDTQVAEENETSRHTEDRSRHPNVDMSSSLGRRPRD